jgi:peptidoglycan/xylan/chitin deacetylase (PgdA/CDA1 family)
MSRHIWHRLVPSGGHQVLIFHRVLAETDPMMPGEIDLAWFDATVAMLTRHFQILPLMEAVELAASGGLPRASLSITFDDGYADNRQNALPILEKHGAHATFFIAVDFIEGGRMWNDTIIETARRLAPGKYGHESLQIAAMAVATDEDRRRLAEAVIGACKYLPSERRRQMVDEFARLAQAPLPDDLMMTWDQVRELHASQSAEIGGHTRSHPILANCDMTTAFEEIDGGAAVLEEKLGRRPRVFAYPNGKLGQDYLESQTALVRDAGFDAAVATDWGVMTAATDRFQIPRFTPWQRGRGRFAVDLLRARYGLL